MEALLKIELNKASFYYESAVKQVEEFKETIDKVASTKVTSLAFRAFVGSYKNTAWWCDSLISRIENQTNVTPHYKPLKHDPHNLKEQFVDLADKISTARSSRQNVIMIDAFETLYAQVDDQMTAYQTVWFEFLDLLSKYGWAKGCRVGFNTELSDAQCNDLSKEIIYLSKNHFT